MPIGPRGACGACFAALCVRIDVSVFQEHTNYKEFRGRQQDVLLMLKHGDSVVWMAECGSGKTLPALLYPYVLEESDHKRAVRSLTDHR